MNEIIFDILPGKFVRDKVFVAKIGEAILTVAINAPPDKNFKISLLRRVQKFAEFHHATKYDEKDVINLIDDVSYGWHTSKDGLYTAEYYEKHGRPRGNETFKPRKSRAYFKRTSKN